MKLFYFLKRVTRKVFDENFTHLYWTCEVCGKELFKKEHFCKECFENLPFLEDKICNHCGRKVNVSTNYCLSCKNKQTDIDLARSVFDYSDAVRLLIHKLKYSGKRYLARIFAPYLANVYWKNYFNVDAIVYVPMFRKDQRKRGFNQSKLLAEELSKLINVPVLEEVIVKTKRTSKQVGLKRKERKVNLKGSFKLTSKKEIIDKSILIVDDVMTTGATVERIAELLKSSGAKTVKALTVASVQIS
ncbi:MAG: ComF family protein [Clostridiales bacterium]|nr:ComF family protein [Clostridiales bacterium]